jgi:lysyl-tRNA synthetase class 2
LGAEGTKALTEHNGTNKFERQRNEKVVRLRELGIEPYGGRYEGSESSASIRERYVDEKEGQRGCAAGRIVLLRDIGKLIFITLRDSSGTIQLGLSKKLLSAHWEVAKLLELGDVIGAKGQLGKTKTGELTIWADEVLRMLIFVTGSDTLTSGRIRR